MSRWTQGCLLVLGSIAITIVALASAVTWGPHHCDLAFPAVIGCALGSYESLAGGLIAAAAAILAGWLAWSAVQAQIEAEARRAAADRVEVEDVLERDIDDFAETLAAIWKILVAAEDQDDLNQHQFEAVIYGIEHITKESWIITSRQMVTSLGWARRRRYEELFSGLDRLAQFRSAPGAPDFDDVEALSVVKSVSIDFEQVKPSTAKHFEGLFRRAGKASSVADWITEMARPPE